jgi:hypothetical protein
VIDSTDICPSRYGDSDWHRLEYPLCATTVTREANIMIGNGTGKWYDAVSLSELVNMQHLAALFVESWTLYVTTYIPRRLVSKLVAPCEAGEHMARVTQRHTDELTLSRHRW